jgi:hypothetical protein
MQKPDKPAIIREYRTDGGKVVVYEGDFVELEKHFNYLDDLIECEEDVLMGCIDNDYNIINVSYYTRDDSHNEGNYILEYDEETEVYTKRYFDEPGNDFIWVLCVELIPRE